MVRLAVGVLLAVALTACASTRKNAANDPDEIQMKCDRGDAKACLRLAKFHYQKGSGLMEAIVFSRMSCEMRNANGCVYLSSMLAKAGDQGQSQAARERACELGRADSCSAEARQIH